MKYYGFWRSLAACRVRIALALKGVKAEEISVNLMQGEQLKPEYRAVNPLAVVPSLILDDGGTPLFESMAIIEYLDETHPQPPLLPKEPEGRARVRGRDYEWQKSTGARLSNFKNELLGCGPFLHNDPRDRPASVFGGDVTLHMGPRYQSYILLPIIPQEEQ